MNNNKSRNTTSSTNNSLLLKNDDDSSSSTSTDDELDVLPPTFKTVKHQQSKLQKDSISAQPRLSYNGSDKDDPINLHDDDNDNDIFKDTIIQQKSTRKQKEVVLLDEDDDDDDDNFSNQMKEAINMSLQDMRKKSNNNVKIISNKSLSATAATVKKTTANNNNKKKNLVRKDTTDNKKHMSTSYDFSSSDDDDSLLGITKSNTAMKNVVTTKKTTITTSYSSDSSLDFDDDDKNVSCSKTNSTKTNNSIVTSKLTKKKINNAPPLAGNDTDTRSDDEDGIDITRSVLLQKSKKNVSSFKQTNTKTTAAATAAKPSSKMEELKKKREAAKLEKERKKEQERREKIAAKEQAKRQRAQRIEQEKESRKRKIELSAQASGKLSKDEIAILIEPQLYYHIEYNTIINEIKTTGGYAHVHEYPSALGCNIIQWIRKDGLQGGAIDAMKQLLSGNHNNNSYQHIKTIAIIVDDTTFLSLLERGDKNNDIEDDYPKLERWIKSIECSWRAAWRLNENEKPRIILFLHKVKEGLDKLWIQHKKRNSIGQHPPTAEELHDAITWILIQFNVECIHCTTIDDITNHICKMTRMIAEVPYQKHVTELSCIKKLKSECSELDTEYNRSKDVWCRQLQQIKGISRIIAFNLINYFPTSYSLWKTYNDNENNNLTIEQKQILIANMFDNNNNRRHIKLSQQLYTIMTSTNPDEILL